MKSKVRIASPEHARDYLYSWNPVEKNQFTGVKIEEDIRDALQCVRTTRPSLDQRKQLVELSAEVGVQYAFLGFPAASARETDEGAALVKHIAQRDLSIEPVFMARALASDILPILSIRERASFPVTADIFISTSELRLKIEGWTFDNVIAKMREAARFATAHDVPFRISLEDSTRTGPDALAIAVHEAVGLGAKAIVLCDTVGDCLPGGASRVTAFVRDQLQRHKDNVDIGWHGHNDKGLALANALAAMDAGASIISGTFMGVGERTGNIPLEQFILILSEAGDDRYNLHAMMQLCKCFGESAKICTPSNLPLIGRNAFSTATGTHVAAIHKARQLGPDFEDFVYSAVSANALGREQTLLIGPNSGRGSIRTILEALQITASEAMISAVLQYCKQQDQCLECADDVHGLLASLAKSSIV